MSTSQNGELKCPDEPHYARALHTTVTIYGNAAIFLALFAKSQI